MTLTNTKYYLRPIGPIRNEEGLKLSKKKQSVQVHGIYFSKIEVISKSISVKQKKIYEIRDFLKIIDKNKIICDVYNKLKYQNKALQKILFKKKKYSIFGILNTTPDSFSDGGKNLNPNNAINSALKMVEHGASFVDVGGESTRPGANVVNVIDEIQRIMPVIQRLNYKKIDMSLDTRNSSTMEFGILSGVKIINDVSALIHDKKSIEIIKKYNIPLIIMHMPGNPKTMTKNNQYFDVVLDVYDFLSNRVDEIVKFGLKRENIIIDPGIGFGKDYSQNVCLIKNLSIFHSLGVPLMLGVSRKRFIESISKETNPEKRVAGTIAATLSAMSQGVRIHRVHDVKEVNQAAMVFEKLIN